MTRHRGPIDPHSPKPQCGITECAFCSGASEECLADETKLGGIVDVVAGRAWRG